MAIQKVMTSVGYTTTSNQPSELKITANTVSSNLRELAAIVEILKEVSSENIDTQEIALLGNDHAVIFKPQKDGVVVYTASVKVKRIKIPPISDELL